MKKDKKDKKISNIIIKIIIIKVENSQKLNIIV